MSSPPNNTYYIRPKRHIFSYFLLILWFGLLGLVALNRVAILDWWKLHNYTAPAGISALSNQDTLTDYGRKVFYVNHPDVTSDEEFATKCPDNGGEQTIVLGCYHSGQAGIYLLNVDDPRLNGVLQVTAAHEMLHAAYERLSTSERQRVDDMINNFYQTKLQDERIKKTIESYRRTEPNDLINEMHSIFGTELVTLTPELENYYKKYFDNRVQIAEFAAKYQAEFTSRPAKIAQYKQQLDSIKAKIDQLEADLRAKQQSLSASQAELNQLRSGGNIAAYNAQVPAHNQLVNSYNTEIQQLRSLINQYNQIVAVINSLATEQNQLVKELSNNSKLINN